MLTTISGHCLAHELSAFNIDGGRFYLVQASQARVLASNARHCRGSQVVE